MLVIARKVGQTVLIGDDVRITISAVRGDQVRLSIAAPRSITIVREEVVQQVKQENLAAAASASDVILALDTGEELVVSRDTEIIEISIRQETAYSAQT